LGVSASSVSQFEVLQKSDKVRNRILVAIMGILLVGVVLILAKFLLKRKRKIDEDTEVDDVDIRKPEEKIPEMYRNTEVDDVDQKPEEKIPEVEEKTEELEGTEEETNEKGEKFY